MIRQLILFFGAASVSVSTLSGQESNPVQSKIEVEEAWMGQRVSLVVTLFSPGPFSGTAVFQIPEIPNTLIVKEGNPLVGSETFNGESMITQRHEFSIYTQQIGTIEIPAFPVDFESKNDFLGDPVPRAGKTSAISFNSKRPPGTEALPFVVSSATLEVKETWSPAGQTDFEAGDILSRSITREATDVSAMFLIPFEAAPIDGAPTYRTEPEVVDKRERGVSTATRTDTIKYQFERGGAFTIPEIVDTWWNPKTEKLEQVTLGGQTVNVTAPSSPPKPVDKMKLVWTAVLFLSGLALAKRFLLPIIKRRYAAWYEHRHAPEAEAARALVRACRRNDPKTAFVALMDWKRAVGAEFAESLHEPFEALSQLLFSKGAPAKKWNGALLLAAFREELRRRKIKRSETERPDSLPPLNPSPV